MNTATRIKKLEAGAAQRLATSGRRERLTLTEAQLEQANAELTAWRQQQRAGIAGGLTQEEWDALPTVSCAYARWQRWNKTI